MSTCLPFSKWLPVLILFPLCTAGPARARAEWFSGLDLENAVARADLILAVRVTDVSETAVVFGGKAERALRQYKFEPVRTLKGVFGRDTLMLTSQELGDFNDEGAQIERAQVRLLLLGRSGIGYTNANNVPSLDLSLPPLRDENDPFIDSVKALISVSQEGDRAKKVSLLLRALRGAGSAGTVTLLAALQRRAVLAAQTPRTQGAVARQLGNPSLAARAAAARTLQALFEADYLDPAEQRDGALAALADLLDKANANVVLRVAALEALGAAGPAGLKNDAVGRQLRMDKPHATFAERSALLRAIGRLKLADRRQAVQTVLEQLPLDAPAEVQTTAGLTLVRLDADQAARTLRARLDSKHAAGLDLGIEIGLFAELPAALAVPELLKTNKLSLNHAEKTLFAAAATRLADPRLVPALVTMLDPRWPDTRWHAVEALRRTDTVEAARALRPHLREEADLLRKLQIAAFLGRHGIRDGYPYALEHMSEAHLMEQAVAALAAIREPKSFAALRGILDTSNDPSWKGAAIRALGALREKDLAPRFLHIAGDLKRPLAPAALIALGDLGELKALPKVREGLNSRNDRVVLASARAAGKLLKAPGVKANDVRDRLASLLADVDSPEELRAAALDALLALKDPRLEAALAACVRDAGLEGSSLLERTERLLRERKIELKLLPRN